MNTHACSFVNKMPKYIHSNINLLYTCTNTDVIKHAHAYIYRYIQKHIHVPI